MCEGTGIDAYELADPDPIHLIFTGMVLYSVKDTLAIVKKVGGDSAVYELDVRAMKMYR